MTASITDKITDTRNAARPNSARVSSGRSAGGTTLACDNLAGWPTASKVHFVTYQIDSNSNPVAGTQLDCYGIVSENSIGSLAVIDGTDAGNSVNDVVEMLPTAAWGQDLADALLLGRNRDGTTKAGVTYPTPILTTPTITDFTSATHTHASAAQGGQLTGSAALVNSTVTADKLSTGANSAVVLTSETSISTSYADLSTTTDTVTVTVGANGLLLVGIFATGSNSGSDAQTYTSFALSGVNTLAGSDTNAVLLRQTTATAQQAAGITKLLTGLTPGSTVVKMKYRVTGNTGTWLNRNIYAIPL